MWACMSCNWWKIAGFNLNVYFGWRFNSLIVHKNLFTDLKKKARVNASLELVTSNHSYLLIIIFTYSVVNSIIIIVFHTTVKTYLLLTKIKIFL